MTVNVADFFNASDDLTVTGTISALSLETEGYFDNDLTEFNLDNSGPAQERYQFVCQEFANWRASVGETMVINSENYTVTGAVADGTGLVTLSLYGD